MGIRRLGIGSALSAYSWPSDCRVLLKPRSNTPLGSVSHSPSFHIPSLNSPLYTSNRFSLPLLSISSISTLALRSVSYPPRDHDLSNPLTLFLPPFLPPSTYQTPNHLLYNLETGTPPISTPSKTAIIPTYLIKRNQNAQRKNKRAWDATSLRNFTSAVCMSWRKESVKIS